MLTHVGLLSSLEMKNKVPRGPPTNLKGSKVCSFSYEKNYPVTFPVGNVPLMGHKIWQLFMDVTLTRFLGKPTQCAPVRGVLIAPLRLVKVDFEMVFEHQVAPGGTCSSYHLVHR